jgi:hypothetical protein
MPGGPCLLGLSGAKVKKTMTFRVLMTIKGSFSP